MSRARGASVTKGLAAVAVCVAGAPSLAAAQTATPPAISPADTAWMLMSAALV